MRIIYITGLVFLLILCTQCASEPAQDKEPTLEEVLPGTWGLVSAKRNGKPTTTLQGVYFNFDTLGMVTTNLTGRELKTQCTINESTFSYKDGMDERTYDTQIIAQDTINISTKIKIFDFSLMLSRTGQE